MRLIIKNVGAAYIEAAFMPNRIDVNIEGVQPESILNQVDIMSAINYYGITELLKIIGTDEIKEYLNSI
jgi:hypothetical protein